jgi:hypothetical protein
MTTKLNRRVSTGLPTWMADAKASKMTLLDSKAWSPSLDKRYLPAARALLSETKGFFFELVSSNNGWFSKSTYILVCKTLADDGGQLHREVFRQDLRAFSQKCIEPENRCMRKGASKDTVPTKNILASSKIKP